ncbi:MAG: GWxTD domain-containing protein [Candidatus Acidiferrales bacterium]
MRRIRMKGVVAALVAMFLLAGSVCRADDLKKLPKEYRDWLERDVAYVITSEERATFLKLASNDEREKFIQKFWEIRNPTPGSPDNTYKDEIYRRIAYANDRFSVGSGTDGWRTDRGRVYITLGPPAQVAKYYNAANLFPMEIWFYQGEHPALPAYFYVVFYNKEGLGDFKLYSPYMDGPDKLVTGVEAVNDIQAGYSTVMNSLGPEVARTTLSLLPDEPVDTTNFQVSLESDVLLGTIRGLANNPFTKKQLDQRRANLENVTSRIIVEGQDLEIITAPVRDSTGLTRCDFLIRLAHPEDFTIGQNTAGNYYYSAEVRVRVFTPENKLIFTYLKSLADTFGKDTYAKIKDKDFGYEGSLPLPPGKYHLDFLLTDWVKKSGLHAQKDVVVPALPTNQMILANMFPFSTASKVDEPEKADVTPFAMAGVHFEPMTPSQLSFAPGQSVEVVYQIWAPPADPRSYQGQKLDITYGVGRPAIFIGNQTLVDEVPMEQFDATGSLVNGKRIPLTDQSTGNYLLTVYFDRPGATGKQFANLNFRVTSGPVPPAAWDVSDPEMLGDLQKGVSDEERGLCHVAEGQPGPSLIWFRRALGKNRLNEASRSNLVGYYFSQKDFLSVIKLFDEDGVTDSTDAETILKIADSFDRTNNPQKAISVLEAALPTRPESGPLYLALSTYYRKVGNDKKADELAHLGRMYLGQSGPGTN